MRTAIAALVASHRFVMRPAIVHKNRGSQRLPPLGVAAVSTCDLGLLASRDLIPERGAAATDHGSDERPFLAAHRRPNAGADTGG